MAWIFTLLMNDGRQQNRNFEHEEMSKLLLAVGIPPPCSSGNFMWVILFFRACTTATPPVYSRQSEMAAISAQIWRFCCTNSGRSQQNLGKINSGTANKTDWHEFIAAELTDFRGDFHLRAIKR